VTPVGAQHAAPRFSLLVAAYNVERYLGQFIDSVERQTFPLDRVEVVVVNDGSTDGTLQLLEAWQKRRPELVTVISKPNGGVPSTRNAGLERATGEWVTFTDPDDVLDERFLAEVDAFLRKRPDTMMVATNRVVISDATGLQSKHALHRHFLKGGVNRLRDLNHDTGHFHGHAASTFFRNDQITQAGLRFEERLRASFEDGHFCNIYLLHVPEPLVGYLPRAVYNYRKRDDRSSQMDVSWLDPGRFTDVLEFGYLALLRDAAARYGSAPSWVQGMVIYELSWFFRMNERMFAPTAAYGETLERFHELFRQLCEELDETGIQTYRATTLKPEWREILQYAYADDAWRTPYAVVDKVDPSQRLMRVRYRYTGEPPTERWSVSSKWVDPVHQKVRDVPFFGRTLLYERIVWLPFGTLRAVLDGRDVDLRTSEPRPPDHRLTPTMIKRGLEPDGRAVVSKPDQPLSMADRAIIRLARTRIVRKYFGDAWVLIDRVFNADDSAEHLFRYLCGHRQGINPWFVIQRGTPDYRRLRKDGYRRIVPHGSLAWKLLMLNCAHLISSHADDVVVRPAAIRRLAEPRWRLTFLQHGVIKDDLSTWLNRKDIDIFVTSTRAELESVAGDHTAYPFTTREVKLTGLPRFDRILEEGRRFPPDERDLIVIAPTWRNWLSTSEPVVSGRHTVSEEFRDSQFAREWTAVVNSREVAELADRTGLTVALLLHPNFQATGKLDTLPHVRTLSFEGQNVQEIFARARVLVTDYSSMFFNAAYIERPVVYFQFDRDLVNAGWHAGRRGYFDYERDGFGPVTLTVDEAVTAITKIVESGPEPDPLYLERIRSSFPDRDGRCCERVANAIIESTRPATPEGHRWPGGTPDVGRRAGVVGWVRAHASPARLVRRGS